MYLTPKVGLTENVKHILIDLRIVVYNYKAIILLILLLFYLIFTPAQLGWTYLLVDKGGANEYLILAMTMVINFVSEFFYQKYYVFKNQNTQN